MFKHRLCENKRLSRLNHYFRRTTLCDPPRVALETQPVAFPGRPEHPLLRAGKAPHTKGEGWRRLRMASELRDLNRGPFGCRAPPRAATCGPSGAPFTGSRESSLTPEGGCSPGLWEQRRGSRSTSGTGAWYLTQRPRAPGLLGCRGGPRRQFGSNELLPPAGVGAGGSRPPALASLGFLREDAPQGFTRPHGRLHERGS